MTCKTIRPLIPLYVGDDLPANQQHAVDSHIAWCGACRDCVAEHRESRDWIVAHRTPMIDGAALDELRRAVRYRVQQAPQRPAIWCWLERAWVTLRRHAAQPMLTMAALALVVVGGVGLAQLGHEAHAPVVVSSEASPAPVIEHDVPDLDDHSAGLAPAPAVAPAIPSAATEGAVAEGGEKQEDLRIEIQTQDPNVRIIWFTSRETVAAMGN